VRQLIRLEFGEDIYSSAGDLNRGKLRAIVFADAAKRRALEQILHPRIRLQWSSQAERRENELFLADIPLLYETTGEILCDRVVVVASSRQTQLQRLMARAQIDESVAQQMIDSQMSLSEKMKRADHVVWNNGTREILFSQASLLLPHWQQ
jgi:dephospho-CoA kinase